MTRSTANRCRCAATSLLLGLLATSALAQRAPLNSGPGNAPGV